jgi:chromosome segregation and condensation protein ScpB
MLFIGGPPVTASTAMNCIRGLTETAFRESIDRLAKRYRDQRRPYAVRPRGDGYVLTIRPEYRVIQERLRGSPREARLSQAALDVMSLIAYRQPITKSECDATRGADTGSALRQLIRLGLISVNPTNRAYTTTSRFLDLFGLSSLQDLPRPDDSHS